MSSYQSDPELYAVNVFYLALGKPEELTINKCSSYFIYNCNGNSEVTSM